MLRKPHTDEVSNLKLRPTPLLAAVHPARGAPDSRLFRAIAELVDVGIWVVDRAGVTVFANKRMAGLLAVDVGRLYSSRLGDLVDLHMQRTAGESTLRPATSDVEFVRADGRSSRLRVTMTPWLVVGDHIGSIALFAEADSRPPVAKDVSRREEPSGWSTLSRREREVIEDIALGDRVPLIATRLYISQSTVRNHLSSAFRKLKVSDQQELVALLRGRGTPPQGHRYIPEPTPGS
jgi:DNA-binding CsgD family transcriptional regulator